MQFFFSSGKAGHKCDEINETERKGKACANDQLEMILAGHHVHLEQIGLGWLDFKNVSSKDQHIHPAHGSIRGYHQWAGQCAELNAAADSGLVTMPFSSIVMNGSCLVAWAEDFHGWKVSRVFLKTCKDLLPPSNNVLVDSEWFIWLLHAFKNFSPDFMMLLSFQLFP